ncbi:hypothetical protein MAR_037462 [Mya arenaria]|uniref:DDE-1 domain-containing protein n=1 Tax=Mya arenaria TaxID=6604 RepID=A0ABY7FNJ6_MYAAR|nr:hypothetical protein MAR_037462 [Mya arenaria]
MEKYTHEALTTAVSAVKRNQHRLRKAADEFGVPVTTIHNHVKAEDVASCGRRHELLERVLVGYLNHPTRINSLKGPSNKWMRCFMKRHPELSERMSTPEVMDTFFFFRGEIIAKYALQTKPEQIFNCDDTGWTGRDKSAVRVIGEREGHVFRKKMSGSGHITAQVCMSASGKVAFHTGRSIEGVPTSWMFKSSKSCHINADMLYQWLIKVFIPNCGKDRPVLLVLGYHDNHITIPTTKAAIENGVVLVGFPGHTTHILQPLDLKVITKQRLNIIALQLVIYQILGPLKSRVAKIVTNVGYVRDGVTVGNHEFSAIFRHAIDQTSPASPQKAFEVTSLFPGNRIAIDTSQLITSMFSAAETSDEEGATAGGKRAGIERRKKDAEEKRRVKAQEAEEERQRKEKTKAAREKKRENEEVENEARKRARMEK